MEVLWVSYHSQTLCYKRGSSLLAATLLSGEAIRRHHPVLFSKREKESILWNTSYNTLVFNSIRIELFKEIGFFCLNLSAKPVFTAAHLVETILVKMHGILCLTT